MSVSVKLRSSIPKEYRSLVNIALKRVEALHGIKVSKWDKDFLTIYTHEDPITFRIWDVEKTTLNTKENADAFLRLLDLETKKLVQDKLYSDITLKAESKGLELQAESVEDDDTIVLTFRVP